MAQRAAKTSEKSDKPVRAAAKEKREWLHHLIGKLSPSELEHARRYVEFLVATTTDDPVLRSALLAPEDDEPETPAERAAVRRGKADIKTGRVFTQEQIEREFGL
jgi:hypothetical protein